MGRADEVAGRSSRRMEKGRGLKKHRAPQSYSKFSSSSVAAGSSGLFVGHSTGIALAAALSAVTAFAASVRVLPLLRLFLAAGHLAGFATILHIAARFGALI